MRDADRLESTSGSLTPACRMCGGSSAHAIQTPDQRTIWLCSKCTACALERTWGQLSDLSTAEMSQALVHVGRKYLLTKVLKHLGFA